MCELARDPCGGGPGKFALLINVYELLGMLESAWEYSKCLPQARVCFLQ
jgi:hypothetical protein